MLACPRGCNSNQLHCAGWLATEANNVARDRTSITRKVQATPMRLKPTMLRNNLPCIAQAFRDPHSSPRCRTGSPITRPMVQQPCN
eukprot:15482820-Alexandrium_andersonii.AAC.1